MAVHFEQTRYGFKYGAAEVTRLHQDETGRVVIGLDSPKHSLQVNITKTGKIRVFEVRGVMSVAYLPAVDFPKNT